MLAVTLVSCLHNFYDGKRMCMEFCMTVFCRLEIFVKILVNLVNFIGKQRKVREKTLRLLNYATGKSGKNLF
jgi:hypothetical protein